MGFVVHGGPFENFAGQRSKDKEGVALSHRVLEHRGGYFFVAGCMYRLLVCLSELSWAFWPLLSCGMTVFTDTS